MPQKWQPLEFKRKLFTNVQEAVLTRAHAALENCFQNEAEGQTRFPGLKPFATLDGAARVYLDEFKGDLIGVTGDGRVYRVEHDGTPHDVTGTPVAGGRRVIFAETDDEKLFAAGDQIIRLAKDESSGQSTEVLSEDAPLATHVAYIDGYVVAIERESGRFHHSDPGQARVWGALSIFTAESKPDIANAVIISPRREMYITGVDSIEQWERLASGTTPFFRRWATGEGNYAPYTLVTADNGSWVINKLQEFVQFQGQISRPSSDDIGITFEDIDDWSEAWAVLMHVRGQKFILLQIPNATNVHTTKGITALLDYRQQRWYSLYGWDNDLNLPARWPGWSYYRMWNRHFVGGEGKIYELDENTYDNDGEIMRMLGRSGHIDKFGESRCDNIRVRLKRGVVAEGATEPLFCLRAIRDNGKKTRWRRKSLGTAGKKDMVIEFGGMGCAHTWQFEYFVTDAAEVEVVKMEVQMTPLGE